MMDDIDVETGEITRALAFPAPSELQRYQTDEALVALTEQILLLGKADLERVQTIDDVRDARAKAQAIDRYIAQTMRDRAAKIEARNNLAELILRQQRRIGAWLKQMPKNKGTNGQLNGRDASGGIIALPPEGDVPTLDDLSISKMQSSRWQKQAAIPEDEFEDIIATVKENGWELSSFDLDKNGAKPHVAHNSGENEWYTPSDYIEAARRAMGSIDLDPASSEIANQIVKAKRYYTTQENGLDQDWQENIWLNPPYSQPEVADFAEKLYSEYSKPGAISQFCVLVNNATETDWFGTLLVCADCICLLHRRVMFLNTDLEPEGKPLQGQIVLYGGDRVINFAENFRELGAILYVRKGPRKEE